MITKVENQLKKHLTSQDKKQLINQLLEYTITPNQYKKSAYQKQKAKIEKLLAELKAEEKSNLTSSGIPWPKVLKITALSGGTLAGVVVLFIIFRRVYRRKLRY